MGEYIYLVLMLIFANFVLIYSHGKLTSMFKRYIPLATELDCFNMLHNCIGLRSKLLVIQVEKHCTAAYEIYSC